MSVQIRTHCVQNKASSSGMRAGQPSLSVLLADVRDLSGRRLEGAGGTPVFEFQCVHLNMILF